MSNNEQTIPWKREEAISVPSSSIERRMAVRILDWERWKKKLKKSSQKVPRFHLIFSFLFGITATSGFSLVSFLSNTETRLPSWGYPLCSLIFVFSLATAICFVYLDRKMRQLHQSDIDEIIEDMESVEKTFPETS